MASARALRPLRGGCTPPSRGPCPRRRSGGDRCLRASRSPTLALNARIAVPAVSTWSEYEKSSKTSATVASNIATASRPSSGLNTAGLRKLTSAAKISSNAEKSLLSAAARNLSLCSEARYPFGSSRARSAGPLTRVEHDRTATLAAMSETVTKAPADGFVSPFPATRFDAILVVSFGGPEGMDDVMPFLENVTRGRNVPRERLEEVAHHYELFGGVSPINAQNRALIAALESRARRARHRPADLLRQPQLGSVPRRRAPRDGRRRRRACARVLHVRLLVVLRLPPVPRGHLQRPAGGRAGCAGGGEDADVLQPSRLDRGQRRPRADGARRSWAGDRTSTSPSRRTRSRRRWRRRAATRTSCGSRRGSSPRPSA